MRSSCRLQQREYTTVLSKKRSFRLGGYLSPATSELETPGHLTYPSSPDSITQLRLTLIMATKSDMTRSGRPSVCFNSTALTPGELELLRKIYELVDPDLRV